MVQRYVPAVRKGDKRIILVDGEAAGAINRVPAPDESRSNLHVGGTAKPTTLTKRDKEICARLGPELKKRGADLHRHRRDRRLSHRDQRHLADRHQADRRFRRPRHRRHDLGRDREEGGSAEAEEDGVTTSTPRVSTPRVSAPCSTPIATPSSTRATSRRPWPPWATPACHPCADHDRRLGLRRGSAFLRELLRRSRARGLDGQAASRARSARASSSTR